VTWTLEELADRAARALVDAEVRVANGRITGVPDGRLIRWYATIGLVDRPLIGSGRVARYGVRHLLQLVAVKRLQAQGLPLAEIQHRLAGATDATLRRIAALPPSLDDPVQDLPVPTDRIAPLPDLSERDDHAAGTDAADVLRPPRRARARNMPEAATPRGGVSAKESPAGVAAPTRFWAARPVPASVTGHALDTEGEDVTRVYGVRVHGLLLFLPAEPADHDIDAIAVAAQPLLDLLADRGLLHRMAESTPREGAPT